MQRSTGGVAPFRSGWVEREAARDLSSASRALCVSTPHSNLRFSLFLSPRLPICWILYSPSSCSFAHGSPHPPTRSRPQPRCRAPPTVSSPPTPLWLEAWDPFGPLLGRSGHPLRDPAFFSTQGVSRVPDIIRKAPESPRPAQEVTGLCPEQGGRPRKKAPGSPRPNLPPTLPVSRRVPIGWRAPWLGWQWEGTLFPSRVIKTAPLAGSRPLPLLLRVPVLETQQRSHRPHPPRPR